MSVDEWDTREVCPDGSCTGVIGAEGRCKVCGHVSPTWNNERERGMVVDAAKLDEEEDDGDEYEEDDDADDDDEVEARGSDPALAALMPEAEVGEHEWNRRTLCPDGACTGVLHTNKVCSVCGKTWP